ncbi:MAG: ABC transporter permease [Massilia sp.]
MINILFAIAGATLLEARRSRLPWLLAALGALALAASAFLRELALTESVQLQAALLAAALRLAAAALVAGFVVTSMQREANDKGDQLLLALALPRAAWLLGRLLGFALAALAPALLAGALCALFAPPAQALLWAVSLLWELWIVAAFSLLCALGLSQPLPALAASAGFYVLARAIGALQLLGHAGAPREGPFRLLDAIALILPRLDRFSRTDWLVYHSGSGADLAPLLVQTALCIALVTAAALVDLYRKAI